MSCSHGEKPDCHSNHLHQGHQSHTSSSFKCGAPGESLPGTLEKLDGLEGIWQIRMSVEWRREVLFQQLDLSRLEGWFDKNHAATHALLAKYHDILSLEPGELGCTGLVKHKIRVVDDEPFKKRFQRISPPIVGKVHAHVKEMLEEGAIQPSQSPWCNAVV